jgi:hypothetical protein
MSNSIDLGVVLTFMRPSLQNKRINYCNVVDETLGHMAHAQLWQAPPSATTFGFHQSVRGDEPLYLLMVEAFHYLLHNGLITRAPAKPNFSSQSNDFVVTERGQEWASGNEPIPEDARRYMGVLCSLVPNLDAIIKQYIEESLIAYQRQAYFAAAVMVGAASEKAIYLLGDAFLSSIQSSQEKKKLADAMQYRSLRAPFDSVKEILKAKQKCIAYSASEGAEQHLLSFFESVRVQRNEAVHPAAAQVTPGKCCSL